MTRIGKIARLSAALREQLNRRLADGENGTVLVAWLNALPEVQTLLQAEFAGRPISAQNLSEWRQGGFRDWQRHQESLALVRELSAQAAELAQANGQPMGETLTPLLLSRYLALFQTLETPSDENSEDWKLLRALCRDVVALRKCEHNAERLKLERKRVECEYG
jgi:hypothetical protein